MDNDLNLFGHSSVEYTEMNNSRMRIVHNSKGRYFRFTIQTDGTATDRSIDLMYDEIEELLQFANDQHPNVAGVIFHE